MVFWKGKEEGKEKLKVKGGQSVLLPIFSYVSRPGSPCRDSGVGVCTAAQAIGE